MLPCIHKCTYGSMKTGPKENWSSLKNALGKIVLLQKLLGKFVRKFADRILWQNNDQCRHFKAAVDSKQMLLPLVIDSAMQVEMKEEVSAHDVVHEQRQMQMGTACVNQV